jgi:hypothetical protein
MACLLKDDAAEIPHIGGTVLDAAEAKEGEVLRSEVAAAVGLLNHQFRRGDFCHHHTLPVSTIILSVLSPHLPPTAQALWSSGFKQLLILNWMAIQGHRLLLHDRFGLVTQFHFDGRSLVLRQSRLLDFRSDEPTTDAYHMIRWMANQPMGETRFRKAAEEELEEPGSRDVDKSSSQLAAC